MGVGPGGAREIEDAEAGAFDLEAVEHGEMQGVEFDGAMEAFCEAGDEAGTEDGFGMASDPEDGGRCDRQD